MPKPSPATDLLSALPSGLLSGLFAKARPTTLTADQVLFISGDEGDGCYRVDDGLLKVSVVAPTGGERILAVLDEELLIGIERQVPDEEPERELAPAPELAAA